MRDRLIELLGDFPIFHSTMKERWMPEAVERLADHLLAEGVIVPPCKVGQTVYVLTTDSPTGIEETKISQVVVRVKENCKMQYTILAPCVYDDWGKAKWSFCDNNFGETFFLTREQAERALERRANDGT